MRRTHFRKKPTRTFRLKSRKHARPRVRSTKLTVRRGRRVRARSSSKGRRSHKEKGAQGARTIGYRIRRPFHVSKSFQKKVQTALTPINSYIWDESYKVVGTTSKCDYFETNQTYNYGYTNAVFTAALGASSSGDECITFRRWSTACLLSNQTNFKSYIRMYECVPRRDIAAGSSPVDLANQGFSEMPGPGSNAETDMVFTLFQNAAFCTLFKILDVKMLTFDAGETKTIYLTDNTVRRVRMDRYKINGTEYYGYLNFSRFFIFQSWGQPAVDSVTPTVLGTSKTNWEMILKNRIEYQYILPETRTISRPGTTLANLPGGANAIADVSVTSDLQVVV